MYKIPNYEKCQMPTFLLSEMTLPNPDFILNLKNSNTQTWTLKLSKKLVLAQMWKKSL